SPFILIDQFGYLPATPKIAVIKDPQKGFDSEQTYLPGNNFALVDAGTDEQVFTASITQWKNSITDESSGDRVWYFDFSEVTQTGNYYVLDVEKNLRSYEFRISPSVYNEVLKHAVRTFFYQRVGFPKEERYARKEWADGASHIGPLQDKNCRLFSDKNNAATERDVSGGWYDAGDYNKYTSWTCDYVVEMMLAYLQSPDAWADNYNIPESGNGIPDLLDEAKWGADHLLRLQFDDGSMISIVGESHASPPSAAKGQSLYGPANTSATLSTAGAFAIASKVYRSIGLTAYADTLLDAALAAWEWAEANPNVLFNNNDNAYNSSGLGAGQMEMNDYGRFTRKLRAAVFLFEQTGETGYRDFVDANYNEVHMMQWNYAYPFEPDNQTTLLYYANLEDATSSVAGNIKRVYKNAMNSGSENFPAQVDAKDPYMAHIKDYTWGCNRNKATKGNMFLDMYLFDADASKTEDASIAALGYIHYLHGVNPLNMVYLSNMYRYGAENGVNEFYHSWFTNGSAKWDRVGESMYGPAPGYLTGGPNPSYNWDGCCPNGCGSSSNNAMCYSESISPPKGQPNQKSYKDFNTSWPLNSWSVTENSCGYQVAYIKLLSKFVNLQFDCNGDEMGEAFIDTCGNCAGGLTGVTPVTNPDECSAAGPGAGLIQTKSGGITVFPNPVKNWLKVILNSDEGNFQLYDMEGQLLIATCLERESMIDMAPLAPGIYFYTVESNDDILKQKLIKN
ncbi:MAG: glycoside hydrolase family 9 protein, partial [Prolixibacteraceae bacterium]|nr:glycoside hydrolase family 9 protein [Prolixibacteraceae bacterium]